MDKVMNLKIDDLVKATMLACIVIEAVRPLRLGEKKDLSFTSDKDIQDFLSQKCQNVVQYDWTIYFIRCIRAKLVEMQEKKDKRH